MPPPNPRRRGMVRRGWSGLHGRSPHKSRQKTAPASVMTATLLMSLPGASLNPMPGGGRRCLLFCLVLVLVLVVGCWMGGFWRLLVGLVCGLGGLIGIGWVVWWWLGLSGGGGIAGCFWVSWRGGCRGWGC